MKKLTIVTYSVTFPKGFTHLGIAYYAGVEYQFTVATEERIKVHADAFDAACGHYSKLFGLPDENGNYIHNSSEIHYPAPTIVSVKDMIDTDPVEWGTAQKAIVVIRDNRKYLIDYQTLSDLSESIWSLVFKFISQFHCSVTLSSGEQYRWNACFAHYCFAEGRITIDEFVKFQFAKEAQL